MPAPTKIYYPQIASQDWIDWVQVINVSSENSNVLAVARDVNGQTVWSGEKALGPFQGWVIPVEPVSVKQELSLTVSSDKSIIGERHCHLKTEVLAFPGAAPELRNLGRRLFFPELVVGCADYFRIFNISDQNALINVIVRDINGIITKQFSGQIKPLGFWYFMDDMTGNTNGTLELLSTQPIAAERHLHYGEAIKGVAVGQLGQLLDPPTPNKIHYAQIAAGGWGDWVQVINVSNENAKVLAMARDENGQTIWSQEKALNPFQGWIVPVDPVAAEKDLSLTVTSDKAITGERHCHFETQVLPFPGACPEMKTAGRRLFFPELVAGCYDFFRFLNITDQVAMGSAILRDINGNVTQQHSFQIKPFGYVTVRDEDTVNLQGTLEILSTQVIVGERHLHYGELYHKGVAIGQLGQVLD